MAAIRRVGLRDAMSLPLHALSGGQLQRALFARAMVQDADLVILDEPFAGVDQKTESDLLALILEWTENGKAVVLVSHDLSSVLNHATNALLLGDGRARFGAPCEVLTSENLIDQGYMTSSQAQWLSGLYREASPMFDTLEAWWSYEFVRRAVIATLVLSISVAPVGCFMVLRRLSLAGEALAHAIVPGIAIAFLISGGLTVGAMLVGGVIAGLAVALSATMLARLSIIREEAGLASLYLIALAIGIFILSLNGSAVPLKSFLFGKILGLSDGTLILIGATATITLLSFAFMLRPLIVSTLDPGFLKAN